MRKRRMPPPTFVLQRLRGASLASLARKYGVSRYAAHKWQWDALGSRDAYVKPKGLCRALARRTAGQGMRRLGDLAWFAEGVLTALRYMDDELTAQRDHAYALLRGGHITMDSQPSTS